jgi:predicted Rossmann fold nucleotide-binding protein DprA/Smf involved in DNA uptake
MNLAVVGGRTFNDYAGLEAMLDSLVAGFGFTTIVSGGANGADSLGERYAKERGMKTIIHLPDWKTHGKAAGMIRNRDIIADADMVVACWDKESRGTANSIQLAKDSNKTTIMIYY